MGYYRAGFTDITGVDIKPMKRYPFRFIQADALEYLAMLIESGEIAEYDAIHSSPPCQKWSEATPEYLRCNHPDLIAPIRKLLLATAKPYVIENVEMARYELKSPIMLCGSMFGLPIWRHRYFESPHLPLALLPPCQHIGRPVLITGMGSTPRPEYGKRYKFPISEKRKAIDIDWMTAEEITEAIPPAYTEWIGRQLLAYRKNDEHRNH